MCRAQVRQEHRQQADRGEERRDFVHVLDAGAIGELTHYRGRFLNGYASDPDGVLSWRFVAEQGFGTLSDLLSHAVDLATMLIGPITEVTGTMATFITERPAEGRSSGLTATAGEGTEKVTVDDTSMFLARFAGGAVSGVDIVRAA